MCYEHDVETSELGFQLWKVQSSLFPRQFSLISVALCYSWWNKIILTWRRKKRFSLLLENLYYYCNCMSVKIPVYWSWILEGYRGRNSFQFLSNRKVCHIAKVFAELWKWFSPIVLEEISCNMHASMLSAYVWISAILNGAWLGSTSVRS